MKIQKDIIVLTNGNFPTAKKAIDLLKSGKFLLCCDGAATKANQNGYSPDMIIGDLDSLSDDMKVKYHDRIIQISNQNSNDLNKALDWARDSEVESLTVLGADAGDDGHYLGNFFLILESDYDFKIKVITHTGEFDLVNNKEFSSHPNQKVSIFCANKKTRACSFGLKYELKNYQFSNLYSATLNEAIGSKFKIKCNDSESRVLVYRENEKNK